MGYWTYDSLYVEYDNVRTRALAARARLRARTEGQMTIKDLLPILEKAGDPAGRARAVAMKPARVVPTDPWPTLTGQQIQQIQQQMLQQQMG